MKVEVVIRIQPFEFPRISLGVSVFRGRVHHLYSVGVAETAIL